VTPREAALRLEAILRAENEALRRHDAQAAVAMLDAKLAAAEALSASGLSAADAERLRALATENGRLLERAIAVQSQIVAVVARAARSAQTATRYGARGRTVAPTGALALARQA
jgi:hypothetical protein